MTYKQNQNKKKLGEEIYLQKISEAELKEKEKEKNDSQLLEEYMQRINKPKKVG